MSEEMPLWKRFDDQRVGSLVCVGNDGPGAGTPSEDDELARMRALRDVVSARRQGRFEKKIAIWA